MSYDIGLYFGKSETTTREELTEKFVKAGAQIENDKHYKYPTINVPGIAAFQLYDKNSQFYDSVRAPQSDAEFVKFIEWADSFDVRIYDYSINADVTLKNYKDVLKAVKREQQIITRMFGTVKDSDK